MEGGQEELESGLSYGSGTPRVPYPGMPRLLPPVPELCETDTEKTLKLQNREYLWRTQNIMDIYVLVKDVVRSWTA